MLIGLEKEWPGMSMAVSVERVIVTYDFEYEEDTKWTMLIVIVG